MTTSTTNFATAYNAGLAALSRSIATPDGVRWYADETGEWCVSTNVQIAELGATILSGTPRVDAYSEWAPHQSSYTPPAWEARQWFEGIGRSRAQCKALGVTATSTDEELDAITRAAVTEGADNDASLDLDDVRRYLGELRQDMQDAP